MTIVIQQLPKLSAPNGYRPQAIDISIEADLLDFYLLRQRSVADRVGMAATLMSDARRFSLSCLQQQFSSFSPQQFARKLAEAWLQEDCPPDYIPRGSQMSWIQNSPALAIELHKIFEAAEIPYYITGGVAAIAYGDPRTTRDVDMVIQLPRSAVTDLQSVLEQAGFYVADVEDVVSGRMKTLQITQIETISRANLMIAEDTDYAKQQFLRRQRYLFLSDTEVYLASPEDVVLNKLRWALKSDSEKQKRDVLAIFKVQQDNLDYVYIYDWATAFGLVPSVEALTMAAGVREIVVKQLAQ